MRYDSSARNLILKSICVLPCVLLKSNPKLCKAVLDSSDVKGKGIEYFLASPGWKPIYNSESVDGERWKKLLTMFRKIVHKVDYSERLTQITEKYCQRLCNEYDNIDSPAIQKITCRIFFELLFRKEISLEDETLYINATNEWRKHIAQKGPSDYAMKERIVDSILKHLHESQFDIENLQMECKADKYELVSSFMQPFLISPIINFSDIFCEVSLLLQNNQIYQEKLSKLALNKQLEETNKGENNLYTAIIYESLRLKHPFPLIERDLTMDVTDGNIVLHKGTHVIIELDSFVQNQKFHPENWSNSDYYKENFWILFATGPRMCAGRMLAIQVLETILRELVKIKGGDFEKLKMWRNHKISGRNNDNTHSFSESIFQIKLFFKVFKEILMKKIVK